MKKAEQIEVNNYVETAYANMQAAINTCTMHGIGQLRTCTAWVYRCDSWFILKSYNTIVAAISANGGAFDFLRYAYGYTATSAQHISKFFADYAPKNAPRYTWREV